MISDINHSNIFFNPSAKIMKKKKRDLLKLKGFCTAKETIYTMKRTHRLGEIFANDVTNK